MEFSPKTRKKVQDNLRKKILKTNFHIKASKYLNIKYWNSKQVFKFFLEEIGIKRMKILMDDVNGFVLIKLLSSGKYGLSLFQVKIPF